MKLGSRPLRRLTYLTTLAVALILVVVAASALPSIRALASGPLVWTTKAPMPVARNGPGVVAASNGKIYAISGGDATGAAESVGTMNEYNPATNTWAAKAPIPTPRFTFGVAEATNGKIYAIAGWSAGWHTYAVEEYDPANNTWATKAPISTERSMLAAAAASNGKVYAIGGMFYVGFTALNTVEEYNPATDTWATKASMPTARSFLAAVTASNGKIYAIGGCNSGFASALATVEEYNPATNTWATKAPMPTARCGLAAVAAPNGKIYAIGGTDMVNSLATVDEYDPATDTWTSATSMPTARSGLGAAVSGGKIYAMGGSNGVSSLATVEEATTLPTGANALVNGDFEIDSVGTADSAITGWDLDFYNFNDFGTRGSSPRGEHALSVSGTRYFSGTKSVSSWIRNNAGGGPSDADGRHSTSDLLTEVPVSTIGSSFTLWRTDVSYTTSSRWYWRLDVVLSDGTMTEGIELTCRAWGLGEGCAGNFQDHSDLTATGADGLTWYGYTITIPTGMDRSNLTVRIRHQQDSWDGTTAESSLYYDLLFAEAVPPTPTPTPAPPTPTPTLVPGASTWGLGVMAALLVGVSLWSYRRGRRTNPSG